MIQFTCTDELLKALDHNGIKPQDYKPAYGGESVGLDLYNAGPDIEIPFGSFGAKAIKIPTGLKVALPPYHAALVFQRGSITKTPLIHRAGVVDPGYTDQIFVPVVNIQEYSGFTTPYLIKQYEKLPFQIVVTPVVTQYCFIDSETYETTTRHAKRKDACIGSSDVVSAANTQINPGSEISEVIQNISEAELMKSLVLS